MIHSMSVHIAYIVHVHTMYIAKPYSALSSCWYGISLYICNVGIIVAISNVNLIQIMATEHVLKNHKSSVFWNFRTLFSPLSSPNVHGVNKLKHLKMPVY